MELAQTPENQKPEDCFHRKTDRLAFGLTTLILLAVYSFTLAPEVTLEYSGLYATDALHPGPSIPPGHPVWVVYGWLFTKLLPFSNIAWRLNMSSAVAGALTGAIIAWLVSRLGRKAWASMLDAKKFSVTEQRLIQVTCGTIAGLGFGLDGCFWPRAVVVDTWPLSLLLLATVLYLITVWLLTKRTRYLVVAAFVLGLTTCESQALIPAIYTLPTFVMLADRRIGRELFFCLAVFLWLFLGLEHTTPQLPWPIEPPRTHLLQILATIATLISVLIAIQTRRLYSEWKTSIACALSFCVGFSAYFLVPVFAMTTPPVNWAYPRTIEGFFHGLTRGQFCSVPLASGFDQCYWLAQFHWLTITQDLGIFYPLTASVALLLLYKAAKPARCWLVGLILAWVGMTTLMLIVLNPSPDFSSIRFNKFYMAPSHLFLAIFSGLGMMCIAALVSRPSKKATDQK